MPLFLFTICWHIRSIVDLTPPIAHFVRWLFTICFANVPIFIWLLSSIIEWWNWLLRSLLWIAPSEIRATIREPSYFPSMFTVLFDTCFFNLNTRLLSFAVSYSDQSFFLTVSFLIVLSLPCWKLTPLWIWKDHSLVPIRSYHSAAILYWYYLSAWISISRENQANLRLD